MILTNIADAIGGAYPGASIAVAKAPLTRLKPRWIGSGKTGLDLLEFGAGAGRIGVAMNDPHQIRPIRLGEPARHLHRDPLARPRRKPVHIADQRHHAANPPPLFIVIRYAAGRASKSRRQIACGSPRGG